MHNTQRYVAFMTSITPSKQKMAGSFTRRLMERDVFENPRRGGGGGTRMTMEKTRSY
jgi:hypothetical protein